MGKRYFTAGWITSLVGAVLLILEYFSLFLLRAVDVRSGLGYFDDPMQYASIPPMPAIFKLTAAVLITGAALAGCSAVAAAVSQWSARGK